MANKRGYQLLCPIARSLDRVGDRWTLLILRDLHAGPAGFNELQSGLNVASNLLSTRLAELQENGLVNRDGDRGPYRLTDLGVATRSIITALRDYGRLFDEPDEPKEPGNLRTAYLPLVDIFEAAPNRPDLVGTIDIDGECFTVTMTSERAKVSYNDDDTVPDTVIATTYRNLMDLTSGQVTLDQHVARFNVIKNDQLAGQLLKAYAAGLVRSVMAN